MASGGGRPWRVLHVEVNEDGTVGGSHQAMYDLVRNVDRTQFEPAVLFYQDNDFVPRFRRAEVDVHVWDDVRAREHEIRIEARLPSKLWEFAASILRRARFLKREQFDLVHINNSPWTGNDDWLPACRMLGIPCVANAMGGADEWDSNPVRRWLFRSFDRVFAISQYIEDGMIGLGVDESRLRTVHLGVDADRIRNRVSRAPSAIRKELGVDEDQLLAVLVGNIRHWKGQHVALEALSALDPAYRQRVVLALAGATGEGNETYEQRLRDYVRQNDLETSVRFLGFRQDVPDLMHAADVAVHSSVRPEPFGLVVGEAMAVGTPVAAAAAGGPVEILDERSGWTWDTSSPGELSRILRHAIENPEERVQRGERARERIEQFSVAQYVGGIERAYTELLDGERPASAAKEIS